MLDLGYGPQPGMRPDVSKVGRIDALLLSHTHADHAGALELAEQLGNPPIYATAIAGALLAGEAIAQPLPLKGTTDVCGIRVTTGRSGHAPGGVWLHLDVDGGLLYTGDYSVESEVYAYDSPPPARTLILDASYGDYEAPIDDCRAALDALVERAPLLLPVPPAGTRGRHRFARYKSIQTLPHVDDAVRAVLARLGDEFSDCVRPTAARALADIARDAPPIEGADGVMLAAVADASRGKAAELVADWHSARSPAIAFTGYVPPGTAADRLTQISRAEFLRWNVHPRLSDNAALVRSTGAKIVLPAFGHTKHHPAWRAAFGRADIVYEGPVLL